MLSKKQSDGHSWRVHLKRLAEGGDKDAAKVLVEGPELHAEIEYLLDLYYEFALGRTSSGMGGGELGWVDAVCWMHSMDRWLEPHEVVALLRIDRQVLNPPDELEEDD